MKHHSPDTKVRARQNLTMILLIAVSLLLVAGGKILMDVFSQNVSLTYSGGKKYLMVKSGERFDKLYQDLQQGYFLDNPESFERLARIIDLEKKLKPGRYAITAGMSNLDVLRVLVKGRQEPVDVVFNYAERLQDLCGFWGRQLEADSNMLYALLTDTSIIGPMGFDTLNVIGLFVPNTYNLYWNTSSTALVQRMLEEYRKFWTQDRLAACLQLGYSQQQVTTLASIVQKETNKKDEMPRVAGVYLNRLKLGMPLQADPTIIYAWNDRNIRRVTSLHTAIPSSYNTYLNSGLPPGPICAPSIRAIDAVLHAEDHRYLYFCAREDFSGYHAFASSFEQHQVNARRYQQALNRIEVH